MHETKHNLTRAEVAEILGVTKAWLEKAAVNGSGPPFMRLTKRTVRYPRVGLDAWLADRTVTNTGQADVVGSVKHG